MIGRYLSVLSTFRYFASNIGFFKVSFILIMSAVLFYPIYFVHVKRTFKIYIFGILSFNYRYRIIRQFTSQDNFYFSFLFHKITSTELTSSSIG